MHYGNTGGFSYWLLPEHLLPKHSAAKRFAESGNCENLPGLPAANGKKTRKYKLLSAVMVTRLKYNMYGLKYMSMALSHVRLQRIHIPGKIWAGFESVSTQIRPLPPCLNANNVSHLLLSVSTMTAPPSN